MQITPVSFCGKADIRGFANQYGPLTRDEEKLKQLALRYHDIEVDRTSDGDYVSSLDKEIYREAVQALKTFATTPSLFAYRTAIDLASADANGAIVYAEDGFKKAALAIAENDPRITKEMILEDFDRLS